MPPHEKRMTWWVLDFCTEIILPFTILSLICAGFLTVAYRVISGDWWSFGSFGVSFLFAIPIVLSIFGITSHFSGGSS